MLRRLLTGREGISTKGLRLTTRWTIIGLFTVVLLLEYVTPPAYVFGYLYIGPILLANARLGRVVTLQTTLVAVILTIANLWVPGGQPIEPATVANRLITVLALCVTGVLSDRLRYYEEAISRQQAKLRAQEQLASLREDFASTLTHDLKTPLLGAVETLKSFQQEKFGIITATQRKVLEMMTRSHQTTLQLVETLLDIYRNDMEGLKLQRISVNLAALAEEAIAELRDLASARRVLISLSYGESDFRRSLWVNGDALQLQRVLMNLITNAINHSPRGSKVEIVLKSYSAHQVVQILDTGQGITADELPHLFERFYQGHGDRQAKGSGLGLYLARQIIEAHGGTIWVENRSPHGASFGFRLPVSVPAISPI